MACQQLLRREVEETRSFSNGLLRTKNKVFGQVIQLWDGQDLLLAQDASEPSEFYRFGLVDGLVMYSDYGGGNREDFLVDFLGSVTGTTLSDGSGSSYTRYKPYGSTYLGATTQFYGWTGQSGSQVMGISFAEQYNRARFVSTRTRQFISKDVLWPDELAYGYVNGNPVTWVDPTGNQTNVLDELNKIFPPGSGVPNWIVPDDHRLRCITTWNPLEWGYGNCCGVGRRCNKNSKTYDCLDEACKEHDQCLATAKEYILYQFGCNDKFCNDIHYCYNENCRGRKQNQKLCQALFEAGTFYCALVGKKGPPGMPTHPR